MTGEFSAREYLRDFRAAGGTAGIYRDKVFRFFGAGTSAVTRNYAEEMLLLDDAGDGAIRAELCAEVIAMSPAELAVLHAY